MLQRGTPATWATCDMPPLAKQRGLCGRADAQAKGMKIGRKPSLTPHQQREARARVAAGETQRSIAGSYKVSQARISRLAG